MGNGDSTGLELDQHQRSLERENIAHRIGWIFMGLFLSAALLGLLGKGPLSNAAVSKEGLNVKYQRFGRYQAPLELQCEITTTTETNLNLVISQKFLDAIEITEIQPEPESVSLQGAQSIFNFLLAGPGKQTIKLNYEPKKFGQMDINLSVLEGETVRLKQFYWP